MQWQVLLNQTGWCRDAISNFCGADVGVNGDADATSFGIAEVSEEPGHRSNGCHLYFNLREQV